MTLRLSAVNLSGKLKVVFAFSQTFVPSVSVSSARCPGGTKIVCILAGSVVSSFIINEYTTVKAMMKMAAILDNSMAIVRNVHCFLSVALFS